MTRTRPRGGLLAGVLAALLATAGLVVGLAVVASTPAWACSCTGITTRTALAEADAVFVGTVTTTRDVGRGRDRRTDLRFAVRQVVKGTVYAEQVVATPPDAGACGLRPDVGSSWVVFASDAVEGDGERSVYRLRTTICSGNLSADELPAGLGPVREPLAGRSDREEVSINTDAAITRVLTLGGVGLLGLAALAGLGLVVLWRGRGA